MIAVLRGVLAAFLIGSGVLHFTAAGTYAQIVPPWLPAPLALVYVSGVAELAGGVGLLIPSTRRWAGLGVIALLIAVFPANVYMATSNVHIAGLPSWLPQPTPLGRWVRLPFQALFIAWAWWVSRPRS